MAYGRYFFLPATWRREDHLPRIFLTGSQFRFVSASVIKGKKGIIIEVQLALKKKIQSLTCKFRRVVLEKKIFRGHKHTITILTVSSVNTHKKMAAGVTNCCHQER